MGEQLKRIKELQAQLDNEKRIQEDHQRELERRNNVITELQQDLALAKRHSTRLENQIKSLEENSTRKNELIAMYESFKAFDNETIDSLRNEVDKANTRIRELELNTTPLSPPPTPSLVIDEAPAPHSEATQTPNNEESGVPTQGTSNEPTMCTTTTSTTIAQEDKQTTAQPHKKLKLTDEVTHDNCYIHSLKFRTQGPMFVVTFEEGQKPKEFHARMICEKYKQQAATFINSKKESRGGKQIETIKKKNIDYLIELINKEQ